MSEQKTAMTKEEKRKKLLGLVALAVVGLLFVAGIAWYSYRMSAPDTAVNTAFYELGGTAPVQSQRVMTALSDGCFIVGVLLTSLGCLTWISTTGFFDMLFYGLHGLVSLLPFKAPKKRKAFYDFKVERAGKRKAPLNAALLVGVAYLLLAVIFTVLFYNV